MKLNQLADQIHAKTIALIAIAKALEFSDLPNPHGGTPLSQSQAQQITAVFRYMRDRQIVEPKAAIAQMQMSDPAATEEIAISLRTSVADELCRRYPNGSMSDRILRLLGAVQSLEQLYVLSIQPQASQASVKPTLSQ
ncbi:MAG: hypothetical protein HLUCCA11_23480 [Phormidesmis priestleyi Ana]|uniref:Uncharacterized protein n=1 Tax=Phormidesmis priestleyi Ana TaxID=1666911 RepID=A0A0P7ZPL6_9CYAN|nr:MAG: hypothetical protein HLUCCA11_23480 [Phormidesmis priestleyi Ana]